MSTSTFRKSSEWIGSRAAAARRAIAACRVLACGYPIGSGAENAADPQHVLLIGSSARLVSKGV